MNTCAKCRFYSTFLCYYTATTTIRRRRLLAALRVSVRPCAIANLNTDAYDGRNIHHPRLWQEQTQSHDVLPEQQQGNCDEEDEVLAESESESKESQTSQGKGFYTPKQVQLIVEE